MTTVEFLKELQRHDIQLSADGERLRCNAPAGALTAELQEQIRLRKTELLEFLRTAQQLTRQQPAIVPLQPMGTRLPMFGVPGHNGDIFCYRHLARALGEDQPFFGMQPLGLDGKSVPMERVEDIAAYFAAQIHEADPARPCVIVGFCAGGGVALELAQQLQSKGHPIALLALLGTPFPTSYRWLSRQLIALRGLSLRVGKHASSLMRGGIGEKVQYLRTKLQGRQVQAEVERVKATDPVLELRRKVEAATMKAVQCYSPRSYTGRVSLFLPSDEWVRVGSTPALWRSVARDLRQEVGPPTCNGDIMLREQHVDFFATLLRKHCAELQAK